MGLFAVLAALVTDDEASGRWRDEVAHLYAGDLVCDFCFPAMAPVSYRGLDGFRAAWRDWLARWGSYYVEIEDVKDAGDSVVVVTRDHGRRLPGSTEEVYVRAAIWTVRDGRVVHMKFNLRRAEAQAAAGQAG